MGTIVFVQPGPIPKILASFKDCHDSNIEYIYLMEDTKTLASFGYNMEKKMVMSIWNFPAMTILFSLPLRGKPTAIAFSRKLPFCALGYADGSLQLIELIGRQPSEVSSRLRR